MLSSALYLPLPYSVLMIPYGQCDTFCNKIHNKPASTLVCDAEIKTKMLSLISPYMES